MLEGSRNPSPLFVKTEKTLSLIASASFCQDVTTRQLVVALSGKCHAVVEGEPESGFKSHAVTVCSCAGLPPRLMFLYLCFVFFTMNCLLALSLSCVFSMDKNISRISIHSQNLHVYDLDLNCSPLCNCAVLVPQSRITWTFDWAKSTPSSTNYQRRTGRCWRCSSNTCPRTC